MSKIKSLIRKKITTEHLFNLSIEDDESYIANGIVVHNCKSFIIPILKGDLGDNEIESLQPSNASLENKIQFSEKYICH